MVTLCLCFSSFIFHFASLLWWFCLLLLSEVIYIWLWLFLYLWANCNTICVHLASLPGDFMSLRSSYIFLYLLCLLFLIIIHPFIVVLGGWSDCMRGHYTTSHPSGPAPSHRINEVCDSPKFTEQIQRIICRWDWNVMGLHAEPHEFAPRILLKLSLIISTISLLWCSALKRMGKKHI